MADETIPAYDIKITIKKWATELGILLGITGLTYLVDTVIPDLQIGYPEYAGIIVVFTPLVVGLINYLKHKNDTKIV
ncbi:MAG: hypothetical protein IMZ52_02850 [Actinobacteria bacterium]|nr:hypothetical protein [Actinomycetota bacterium]MBE3114884.1 hypothetical protein [Actinomycetota bacterium]